MLLLVTLWGPPSRKLAQFLLLCCSTNIFKGTQHALPLSTSILLIATLCSRNHWVTIYSNSKDFGLPEKSPDFENFEENKNNLQNLSYGLGQRLFYPNFYLIQYFRPLDVCLIVQLSIWLSIRQGLTLALMEQYQVLL